MAIVVKFPNWREINGGDMMGNWKCRDCGYEELGSDLVTNGYCRECKKHFVMERFDPLDSEIEINFTIEEIKLIAKVWNREIDCKEYEPGSACPCAECQDGQLCVGVTQKLNPFLKK